MVKITKKRKKFWFEDNQDAQGYTLNDNRIVQDIQNRREQVRRTWNIT